MPMYRVYFWCAECNSSHPRAVLLALADPNLAGKFIAEVYADRPIPAQIQELLNQEEIVCRKGHRKQNLTPEDFFLDDPQ